ncbi:hypothetical protein HYV10_00560 [Candidatus Dependentiae bacterium]|nr:hypothetical protein [Candidatus Dependentiae bacterium]
MNTKKLLLIFSIFITPSITKSAHSIIPATTQSGLSSVQAGLSSLGSKTPYLAPSTTIASQKTARIINLNQEQIQSITDALSSRGGKAYLSQFQYIWKSNRDLFYTLQQAIKSGSTESARVAVDAIMQTAKQLPAQDLSSIQNVMSTPQLKAIKTNLDNDIDNIKLDFSTILYNSELISKFPRNSFYITIDSPIQEAISEISEILSRTTDNPQQAAYRLNRVIDKLEKLTPPIKDLNESITDSKLKEKISSIIEKIDATKNNLKDISSIFQKTAPGQAKAATYHELESFVASISTPTSPQSPSTTSLVNTTGESLQPASSSAASSIFTTSVTDDSLSNVAIPAELKKFFALEIYKINQQALQLTQTAKKLFQIDMSDITQYLSANQQKSLEIAQNSLRQHLILCNKIINDINKISDHPNALMNSKELNIFLNALIIEIIDSLITITQTLSPLAPSKKETALASIQAIIEQLLTIQNHTKSIEIALFEYNSSKKEIVLLKKQIDLAEFVHKSNNDLQLIKETGSQLSQILSSNDILKVDKAPMGMIQVLDSKLLEYGQIIQKIQQITNLEELIPLKTQLKQLEEEFKELLQALQTKLAWLPTSTSKRQALAEFENLQELWAKTKNYVENIFGKINDLTEKHLTIYIKKDSIKIEYLLKLEKYKALTKSITKNFPETTMSQEQKEAYLRLNTEIEAIKNNMNDIIATAKIDSSLTDLAHYEETFKETLKLFGLRLVLGITATGTIGWIFSTADKAKEEEDLSMDPEIEDNKITELIMNTVYTHIKTPKTEEEFKEESNKVIEQIEHLQSLPISLLDKATRNIDFNMKILNLRGFQEMAQIFTEKVKTTIISLLRSPIGYIRIQYLTDWWNSVRTTQEKLEDVKVPSIQITWFDDINNIIKEWDFTVKDSDINDDLLKEIAY